MRYLLQFLVICILFFVLHQPSEANIKIINGTSANISDYPFIAQLRIQDYPSCGATFISPKTLLTAAHCVMAIDVDDLSFSVASPEEIIPASSKIVHEKFCDDNSKCLDYDIAIVTLLAEPSRTPNIIPLNENNGTLTEGTVATVLGWGYDGSDEAFEHLHKLDVPIISQKDCARIYSDVADINERMICAGYVEGGRDYCWGDSGGPLIVNNTLVGVVSWAEACGEANKPGVYVNVALFRAWIKENAGV